MGFFGSLLFFLVATVLLAIGMAKAMMGSPLILIIGSAIYIALFIKYGCFSDEAH